jgi:putative NADPH-quinone reductase
LEGEKYMKVLAVVGTKRKKGLVSRMCEKILEGANENGHETEIINLYDYNINYCIGCWACAKKGKCIYEDDFESIFKKIEESDVIILGSPCYWGDVSGIMKNFFDRHTGSAMYKPDNATGFYKMKLMEKLKTYIYAMKNFGAYPYLHGKKFMIVVAMTLPFPASHLSGELPQTVRCMKIYIGNLKGKLIGKVIYTDTLFKLLRNKEERVMKKAYIAGKKLK